MHICIGAFAHMHIRKRALYIRKRALHINQRAECLVSEIFFCGKLYIPARELFCEYGGLFCRYTGLFCICERTLYICKRVSEYSSSCVVGTPETGPAKRTLYIRKRALHIHIQNFIYPQRNPLHILDIMFGYRS